MAFDRALFGSKVRRLRKIRELSIEELADEMGLAPSRLDELETGRTAPTGDEVLILAAVFQEDFRFFISGDIAAPVEEAELLYRMHGEEFSKADRYALQEFLYLCRSAEELATLLGRATSPRFVAPQPEVATYGRSRRTAMRRATADGRAAAEAVRRELALADNAVAADIFELGRRLGVHIFRRKLGNSSKVSGLFLQHPTAGPCVLVNHSEDLYRQRFSAAHELGHAIMDRGRGVVVSLESDRDALIERRANAFAAALLIPARVAATLPVDGSSADAEILKWAEKLQVNVFTLCLSLAEARKMTFAEARDKGRSLRLPRDTKRDPELLRGSGTRLGARRESALRRGLSHHYVSMVFDALEQRMITTARAAEVLLVTPLEVREMALAFGRVA